MIAARTSGRRPVKQSLRVRRSMRIAFGRAIALATCVLFGAPGARSACDPPRCIDVVVPVPATIAVPDSTVRVLLPVGYDTSLERYPVLYLLHGAGDTYVTWTENTDV